MQKILSSEQIENFRHDGFVDDQVCHFIKVFDDGGDHINILDMGGGCGFFARQLSNKTGYTVKVMDMDPASVDICRSNGIDAEIGDAITPKISASVDAVCLNLILHHLVGVSESDTRQLQTKAMSVWVASSKFLFVHEYIYESYFGGFSGWLIFQITKSSFLSWFGKMGAKLMPSLKANTFDVGVRFRAAEEWREILKRQVTL